MEMMQLLELQGIRQHQVLRGVGGEGSREYGALEGHDNQYWPIRSSILALRNLLTEKPGSTQSTLGSERFIHDQSDPACIDARLFCLWQLCPSKN